MLERDLNTLDHLPPGILLALSCHAASLITSTSLVVTLSMSVYYLSGVVWRQSTPSSMSEELPDAVD
jgi:hypothetical protein